MRLDCNALVGNWPFRKIRDNTIEKIEKKHLSFGIEGGFVSSSDAVFYNDPMEADLDLAKALEGKPNYRHVITVNPALPGACANIKRALHELSPAGVRIYPNFHDFELHSPELEAVCDILREHKLPLFLTMRMDDPRAEYMLYSRTVDVWDVIGFIQRHRDFPIVICNARIGEVNILKQAITVQDNVCVDICGFKESEEGIEQLCAEGMDKYIVYGSNAPIFAFYSTAFLMEKLGISEESRERIMSGRSFLEIIEGKYRPSAK